LDEHTGAVSGGSDFRSCAPPLILRRD
jgi:hypothetical protein